MIIHEINRLRNDRCLHIALLNGYTAQHNCAHGIWATSLQNHRPAAKYLLLGRDLFSPFRQIAVIGLNGRYRELIHIRWISMLLTRLVHFVRMKGDVRGDKCCSFPLTWGLTSPLQWHTAPSGLATIYFQLKVFFFFLGRQTGQVMGWTGGMCLS